MASSGTVFDNAYCNVAVCSPSRMSFLSGRRPTTTNIYNFVNHIRQATCEGAKSGTRWIGAEAQYKNVTVEKVQGAAGECCSQCTRDPACAAWTYVGATVSDGDNEEVDGSKIDHLHSQGRVPDYCALYGDGYAGSNRTHDRLDAPKGVVSGLSGRFLSLTALPQHFKQQGYLALQSGKIWHTEEGDLYGDGMPPNQDAPLSWSPGCSMANVNEIANMWACEKFPGTQGCPIDATADGVVQDGTAPLCDHVIGEDAVQKLRLAAKNLQVTGQPFFLAAGFRKPHMPWRFPAPYTTHYPSVDEIAIAAHPTMDPSVPPIAHHTPDLQYQEGGNPYVAMNKTLAQHDRLYYYSSVSWTDSRVGLVLDELDTLGLTANTLVVMHADHGWALGEHGQWQKFNNWEVGVRVPLIIRAPWLHSPPARTNTLVELVDVFPTMADLAGLKLPTGDDLPLDGQSVGWALRAQSQSDLRRLEASKGRAAALSVYARCPLSPDQEHWITNTSEMWMNNWCEFVDRSAMPWMGYSMRTSEWRYTEWVRWDGDTLSPDWTVKAGVELYDHNGDNGTSFDTHENVNIAVDHPDVVARLSKQLHSLVADSAP